MLGLDGTLTRSFHLNASLRYGHRASQTPSWQMLKERAKLWRRDEHVFIMLPR